MPDTKLRKSAPSCCEICGYPTDTELIDYYDPLGLWICPECGIMAEDYFDGIEDITEDDELED